MRIMNGIFTVHKTDINNVEKERRTHRTENYFRTKSILFPEDCSSVYTQQYFLDQKILYCVVLSYSQKKINIFRITKTDEIFILSFDFFIGWTPQMLRRGIGSIK